jgi:hypothetical protein
MCASKRLRPLLYTAAGVFVGCEECHHVFFIEDASDDTPSETEQS